MCINCKNRLEKQLLYRFEIKDNKIIYNTKNARGFYICQKCIQKNEKEIQKAFYKVCKNIIQISEFKERFLNVKSKNK